MKIYIRLFFLLNFLIIFNSFSSDKVTYEATHNDCGTSNSGDCCVIMKRFIASVEKYYEKSSLILDAGCGWGAESYCLLKSGFKNIYSLDPDIYHLERLRSKANKLSKENNINLLKNIRLVHGRLPESIYQIEIPNHKWSVIILKDVMHFMRGNEIEETLNFFIQNIEDDGVLYIRSVNKAASSERYKNHLYDFMNEYKNYKKFLSSNSDFIGLYYNIKYFGEDNSESFRHYLAPFQIERLLSNVGFKHIEFYQLSPDSHIFIASKVRIPDLFVSFLGWIKKENDKYEKELLSTNQSDRQ